MTSIAPILLNISIIMALVTNVISVDLYIPNLPQMALDLNATESIIRLSVGISVLSSSMVVFFIGPLSDAIGRRPLMLGGQFIYMLAAILPIIVTTVEGLMIARILQGASGTIALVLTFAIISDRYQGSRVASTKILCL